MQYYTAILAARREALGFEWVPTAKWLCGAEAVSTNIQDLLLLGQKRAAVNFMLGT